MVLPKAQTDVIASLESIIKSSEKTLSDIDKKFEESRSDLIYDFRDVDRVSNMKQALGKDYEQRIAKCKELKNYVIEPTAEETMAMAISNINEFVRLMDSKYFFQFLPKTPPATFGSHLQSLLESTSSHFQKAMAGLQTTDDIDRFYKNALDKLTADLAFVAGKQLSDAQRRRQQVFHWTVFVNALNEYGKKAFASKHPRNQ